MGLGDALRNNENAPIVKRSKVFLKRQDEWKCGSSAIRVIIAPDFTTVILYDTLRYEQT
jgi:hypothetical protein